MCIYIHVYVHPYAGHIHHTHNSGYSEDPFQYICSTVMFHQLQESQNRAFNIFRSQTTDHRPQATGHRPRATGYRPPSTGHRSQAIGHGPQGRAFFYVEYSTEGIKQSPWLVAS